MRCILLALLFFPCVGTAAPKCEDGDALLKLTSEQKQVVVSLGGDWLKHATFCDFGTYQVMTPSDPKSDIIVVLRAGKPFVLHEPGLGINLFQDIGERKSIPYLSVQDTNSNGLFRRLDYALVDAAGKVVGNVHDKSMTGEVTVTRYPPDKQGK